MGRTSSGSFFTFLECHGCDLRDQTMALLPGKPEDAELGAVAAHIYGMLSHLDLSKVDVTL